MAEIKHRDGCDRPTGPTGTEAACDCAMYQGQFPPPEGYEEAETLDVEQLVGCNVTAPGCVVETGEYCGEDPCPHDEAAERICPDCGNGASPGTHADDCPKVPQLRALLRLLGANERMQRVRDLLAAHDGNAPPSAYETLRRIREVLGDG